jgi:hypothetical protein
MPKMSAREEELELEMEGLDGGYEAEEEEGLVEESTSSHYSPLVDRLFSGYRGQIQQFEEYVGGLECPELLGRLENPGRETPVLITSWIESSFGTAEEPASVESAGVRSLGGAEKMRSLASHFYAIDQGYGSRRFAEKADRSWSGNPSLSDFVEQYMKSLKRRKARAGENSSVKAITSKKIRELYEYNMRIPFSTRSATLPRTTDGVQIWGGVYQRIMMTLIYAIAFQCLLRLDEVAQIEVKHLRKHELPEGPRIELILDYRKTCQPGEIQPFFFYPNPIEPWLDVPALLYLWLHFSRIQDGFLFRAFIAGSDGIDLAENRKPSPGLFLLNFRHNLVDISEDPFLYGSHSFCRGGAQFFYVERNWDIPTLCDWGGWSPAYSADVIFRYLARLKEEHRLNPDVASASE